MLIGSPSGTDMQNSNASVEALPLDAMRTAGQVRQQLKQVVFRHLQRELQDNFRVLPPSCQWNRREPIAGTQEWVGVCACPATDMGSPNGNICDTRVADGEARARRCSYWQPKRTKDQVKVDFRAFMAKPRGEIAVKYPDVAALMWVLDGVDVTEVVAEVEGGFPQHV